MPGALSNSGAALPATNFAPLHVNRMVTGMWSNSNPLRDAATPLYVEKYQGGRQDRIKDGHDCEISPRLTLTRRKGLNVYNTASFGPINRFYGWNTFTLADEHVRVMADEIGAVYDITATVAIPNRRDLIFTKSAGAGPTFFLGVGNILYMTNGVDSVQVHNAPAWQANKTYRVGDLVVDPNGSLQQMWGANPHQILNVTTGDAGDAQTAYADINLAGGTPYAVSERVTFLGVGTTTSINGLVGYVTTGAGVDPMHVVLPQSVGVHALTATGGYVASIDKVGVSGASGPVWAGGPKQVTLDGTVAWVNQGTVTQKWGIDGPTVPPSFTSPGSLGGNVPGVSEVQYGYAWKSSTTGDLSNMSPPSIRNTVSGGSADVTGKCSPDPQADIIVIYRIQQLGSTFLEVDQIPATADGSDWRYLDTKSDDQLNTQLPAQVNGEGTPPPAGATCMEYHLGRPWVASGNVVWMATGPDASAFGTSGNAGFATAFVAQSKVIRLWANSLGLVVFTVRDSYIIQVDQQSGTLYMSRWIENLPLLNYDAFCVFLTTPYMFTGNRTLVTLDSGAGIVEMSFPIADKLAAFDPAITYCTFHTGPSGETALYIGNALDTYYRMSPTSAPESGILWHPAGKPAAGFTALQSVEIRPGVMALLFGPLAGAVRMRDPKLNTDYGVPFSAEADIGSIVLSLPGQLAGLAWMNLESTNAGSAPQLGVLLDEISGPFEDVPRTRQDPPNKPPSKTVRSNRHSLLQNQRPVWCRHMQYSISWPAEDAANELLTTTIFGQQWQEQRSEQ